MYTSIFKSGCLTWLQQRLRISINFAPKKQPNPFARKNGYFPICFSGSFFLVAPRNYESHLTCNGLNQFLTKGLKARRTMERRAPSKCSVGTSALNGLCWNSGVLVTKVIWVQVHVAVACSSCCCWRCCCCGGRHQRPWWLHYCTFLTLNYDVGVWTPCKVSLM